MDTYARTNRILDILLFCLALLLSTFGYELLLFIMTVRVYNLTQEALTVGIFTTIT